jgi:hypothetical protein
VSNVCVKGVRKETGRMWDSEVAQVPELPTVASSPNFRLHKTTKKLSDYKNNISDREYARVLTWLANGLFGVAMDSCEKLLFFQLLK